MARQVVAKIQSLFQGHGSLALEGETIVSILVQGWRVSSSRSKQGPRHQAASNIRQRHIRLWQLATFLEKTACLFPSPVLWVQSSWQ